MNPRASRLELIVLDLLRNSSGAYGLELVRQSDGKLKRGAVYTTLNRMVDKKYLSSEQEKTPKHAGLPRRTYRITGLGQQVLAANDAAQMAFAQGGNYA